MKKCRPLSSYPSFPPFQILFPVLIYSSRFYPCRADEILIDQETVGVYTMCLTCRSLTFWLAGLLSVIPVVIGWKFQTIIRQEERHALWR